MSTASLMNSTYPSLPGFDKRNRELVYAMVDSGWVGRITNKGHWLGKAPDGKTTITVPSKDSNGRGLKNAHATFMRWLKAHMTPEIQQVWQAAAEENDPLIKDVLAESVVRKQAQQITQERTEREYREAVEHVKKAISAGTIVIEPLVRPWMARKQPGKNGGVLYASEAVLERVWPDGKTDYVCSICEWESENPRSVAAHYGKAHTLKGEVPPASQDGDHVIDPTYTEPTSTRDYRPTQRLLDALMQAIDTEEFAGMDAYEQAMLILTWMHERPDIEHEERPLVPLTDAQRLDKIRLIVGLPNQQPEIDALKEENLALANEVTRLKEERAALRDLLSGE